MAVVRPIVARIIGILRAAPLTREEQIARRM